MSFNKKGNILLIDKFLNNLSKVKNPAKPNSEPANGLDTFMMQPDYPAENFKTIKRKTVPSQNRESVLPRKPEKSINSKKLKYYMLAEQINNNLVNSRLEQQLNDKNKELEEITALITSMSEISYELSNITNIRLLLSTLLLRLIQSFACTKGILLTFTSEPSTLEVFATYNINHLQTGEKVRVADAGPHLSNLLKTGKPQLGNCDNFLKIKSEYLICLPLKSESGMLGVLCLFDKDGIYEPAPFNERDESVIVSLINQTSTQWQKMKLFEMASYDSLTKLYNRRFFEHKLLEDYKKARRYAKSLSVMMIDIDFFKKFNDIYGHHIGDEVLRTVANEIRKLLRKDVDIAARYGGEEFVIIMPDTSATGALVLAERIRNTIETIQVSEPYTCVPLKVTVSIGISTFPDHDSDSNQLIEMADRALYKSKSSGRNKVSVYSP